MTAHLAPHIHLAVLGDDVVILDVLADAYLCVPGGRLALRPQGDGVISPIDPRIGGQLQAAGFLASTPANRRAAPPPLPDRDVLDLASAPPTPREAGRLLLCVLDVLVRYRRRPLDRILAFVEDQGRAAPQMPPGEVTDEVLRLSALFQRAAVWLPIPRKCLVRSFVLLRFLQRSGVHATWVYGVRTWPFAAHCWLQHGPIALDDAAERLCVYEPIFAAA